MLFMCVCVSVSGCERVFVCETQRELGVALPVLTGGVCGEGRGGGRRAEGGTLEDWKTPLWGGGGAGQEASDLI